LLSVIQKERLLTYGVICSGQAFLNEASFKMSVQLTPSSADMCKTNSNAARKNVAAVWASVLGFLDIQGLKFLTYVDVTIF